MIYPLERNIVRRVQTHLLSPENQTNMHSTVHSDRAGESTKVCMVCYHGMLCKTHCKLVTIDTNTILLPYKITDIIWENQRRTWTYKHVNKIKTDHSSNTSTLAICFGLSNHVHSKPPPKVLEQLFCFNTFGENCSIFLVESSSLNKRLATRKAWESCFYPVWPDEWTGASTKVRMVRYHETICCEQTAWREGLEDIRTRKIRFFFSMNETRTSIIEGMSAIFTTMGYWK